LKAFDVQLKGSIDMPLTVTRHTSLPAGLLSAAEVESRAALLKAVAHPVRLRLLDLIRANDAQEACVCQLTEYVGLSQPTVSHHLKLLVDAGVLEREKRGTWAWYSLHPDRLEEIAGYLEP